jgi:hypothetical protein
VPPSNTHTPESSDVVTVILDWQGVPLGSAGHPDVSTIAGGVAVRVSVYGVGAGGFGGGLGFPPAGEPTLTVTEAMALPPAPKQSSE